MNQQTARVLLISADDCLQAAFAPYCTPDDIERAADAAGALDLLHGRGAHAGQTALRPRLLVLDAHAAGASAVAALKRDVRAHAFPLVVLCDGAAVDACYRAGANACVVRPAAGWDGAAGAVAAFWLGANEVAPGD
jgi:hypothetical protein